MLNKIAEFVKTSNTKRLGLAIVISVVLHVYLMGGINIHLPSQKQEIQTIEATLRPPKIVATQEKIIDKPTESKTSQPKKEPKQSIKETVPQKPQIEEVVENSEETVKPLQTTDLTSVVSEVVTTEQPDEAPSVTSEDIQEIEPQPIDTGLAVNENAYQYVETDFDVRTEIDGAKQGSAKITYSLNGQQYQLKSVMKPQGLAALIIGDLLQTSDGILTKNGLQPDNYLYQYSDKADKTYSAKFDWSNKKVNLMTVKGTKTAEIADGTQDLLSFMYQFMFIPPLERMQISIATGKKLATYDYSFDGEQNINIPLGEIKTLHIVHTGDDNDEKTELWLALDYQYVPVKIRKTEKNGKIYELVAKRINTARPVVLN